MTIPVSSLVYLIYAIPAAVIIYSLASLAWKTTKPARTRSHLQDVTEMLKVQNPTWTCTTTNDSTWTASCNSLKTINENMKIRPTLAPLWQELFDKVVHIKKLPGFISSETLCDLILSIVRSFCQEHNGELPQLSIEAINWFTRSVGSEPDQPDQTAETSAWVQRHRRININKTTITQIKIGNILAPFAKREQAQKVEVGSVWKFKDEAAWRGTWGVYTYEDGCYHLMRLDSTGTSDILFPDNAVQDLVASANKIVQVEPGQVWKFSYTIPTVPPEIMGKTRLVVDVSKNGLRTKLKHDDEWGGGTFSWKWDEWFELCFHKGKAELIEN